MNKQVKKNLISFMFMLVILGVGSSVYANGGPIDSNGLVEGGNIKFEKVNDIYVKKENLNINISRDYIDVNVEYLLSNQGEKRDIKYVFPILIWLEEHGNGDFCIENINMKDGEYDLKYNLIEKKSKMDMNGEKINEKFTNEWGILKYQNLYSQLHFEEKELKKLTVSYRINGMYLDWGISNSFLPSSFADSYFSYDLSPAANWGTGKAEEFSVTVDYRDLLKIDGQIKNTNLVDFKTSDLTGVYKYSAKNYDFKEHGMLEIDYDNKVYREKNFMQKHKLTSNMLKDVKVSSSLKTQGKYNYGRKNLFDGDLSTCWAEGVKNNGIGETIELSFNKEVNIGVIGLINGNTFNKDTYYQNARVKKLKIQIIDDNKENVLEKIVIFDDKSYEQIDKNYIHKSMQIIKDFGDGFDVENKKIRLTILEVFPGSKYKDTCISEILLYGYNHKVEDDDNKTIQKNEILDEVKANKTYEIRIRELEKEILDLKQKLSETKNKTDEEIEVIPLKDYGYSLKGLPLEQDYVVRTDGILLMQDYMSILNKKFEEQEGYNDVSIDLEGLKITYGEVGLREYVITSNIYMTQRGITIGSTRDEVRNAYGELGLDDSKVWYTFNNNVEYSEGNAFSFCFEGDKIIEIRYGWRR